MTRNILLGMCFIGAVALSSCSTQNKLASTKATADDDVYFTKAKAGDAPVYAVRQDDYRQNNGDNGEYENTYNDGDYYDYDSYSARLNRFYNPSPFLGSYYDDLYYGYYNPYYSGFSLGFGLGYGSYGGGYFGYSPYSYGYNPYGYYGYNPYFGYSNFGYYGSTIGYGVSPYWGTYSYYNTGRSYGYGGNARPYRGSGVSRPTNIVYGNTSRAGAYSYGNGRTTNTVNQYPRTYSNGNGNNNNGNNNGYARPVRTQQPQQQQPQVQSTQSQSSGSSNAGSSGGGGGGGRPVRP